MSGTIYIGAKDRQVIGGDGIVRNAIKRDAIKLSKEDVVKLFVNRNENRDKIVRAMYLYCYKIARQLSYKSEYINDYFQTALLGVSNAIDLYDSSNGTSFHTFANFYILKEVSLLSHTLKFGNCNNNIRQLEGIVKRLKEIRDNVDADDVISEYEKKYPEYKYRPNLKLISYLLNPTKIYTVLNNSVSNDDDSIERHELIKTYDDNYNKIDNITFWDEVVKILKKEYGRKWVKMYYCYCLWNGIDGFYIENTPITMERARQIKDTINQTLSKYPYLKNISDYGVPVAVDYNYIDTSIDVEIKPIQNKYKIADAFESDEEMGKFLNKLRYKLVGNEFNHDKYEYDSLATKEEKYNWIKINKERILNRANEVPVNVSEEWNYIQASTKPLLPNEILKKIFGYDNIYISNYGRLFKKEKDYKLMYVNYNKSINKHYSQVYHRGKKHTFILHRLVAKYFISNPRNYPDVLFINGNNEDCRVENLMWGIQPVNIPTWNPKTKQKGETCIFNEKLTENQVVEIYNDNRTQDRIAKDYNISRPFVTMIKSGKRWGWLTKDLTLKKQAI